MPDLIADTIFLAGHWEPAITEYVRQALQPGDTFIDIGANVGYYSVLASGIVGETGMVFAVEAHPRIYERLKRNIQLNARENVRMVNAAAGASRGELPLFLGPENNSGRTTTVAELAQEHGFKFDTKIRSDTLESLVGAENLYCARLIKIDVEGAEHSVLAPLFDSLDRFAHSTEWLLELSPQYCPGGHAAIDEIYTAFRTAGYSTLKIDNPYGVSRFEQVSEVELTPITTDVQRKPQDVLMTKRPLGTGVISQP